MTMRRYPSLAIMALLSCALPAQAAQQDQMTPYILGVRDAACDRKLDQFGGDLAGKTPLKSIDEMTQEMMQLRVEPTPEEARALEERRYLGCNDIERRMVAGHPRYQPAWESAHAQMSDIINRLIRQQITWGEGNRALYQAWKAFAAAVVTRPAPMAAAPTPYVAPAAPGLGYGATPPQRTSVYPPPANQPPQANTQQPAVPAAYPPSSNAAVQPATPPIAAPLTPQQPVVNPAEDRLARLERLIAEMERRLAEKEKAIAERERQLRERRREAESEGAQ